MVTDCKKIYTIKEVMELKTVCKLDQCTGCMACIDICPKDAVRIKDSLISYNAIIDEKKCINCNACHLICQNNSLVELTTPILVKEGWALDENIRKKSSSGGIASELARSFVRTGGIVCSCSNQNGNFEFSFAENEEEVNKFVGSKYIKSNPKGIYKEISKKLKNGEKVLFIGLQCQVAALKKYIKDDKLYTVDLICHGTPSPLVLEAFLKDYGLKLNEMKDISFRNKMKFGLKYNLKEFHSDIISDNYLYTFLNSTTYTENCYSCKYARLERVGDVTLGDSWGSTQSEEEKMKGISLVLCQSDKGKHLLSQANLQLLETDLKRAVKFNHQLEYPSKKPKKRGTFLNELSKNKRFNLAFFKCYPKRFIKRTAKILLNKFKHKK